MKLRELSLANYRGFEQLEVSFSPDLTVIAGVNGSGKSGLLRALRQLCSKFEIEVFAVDTSPVGLENSDIKIGKDSLSASLGAEALGEIVSVQMGRALIADSELPRIERKISDLRADLRFTGKRSEEAISIEVEIDFLESRLKGYDDSGSIHAPGYRSVRSVGSPFPVFVFYSTQRAFTDLPKKLLAAKPLSTEAAHENALADGRVTLSSFANWFRVAISGELGVLRSGSRLWEALQKSIAEILPEFGELRLETPDKKLPFFSIEKGGVRFPLRQLSDGEIALLALAMDLTQRLALANPKSASPTTEGVGIVFIDEIELHLHPKWQRQVLRRLTKAFPKCQFIVTTHSPQIIGQTRPECLRLLYFDENARVAVGNVGQAKGMDSSWILQNIMGCPARDYETEQKLSAIFSFIDDGQLLEAREACEALEAELGGFPDLQEAASLLDRLELLAADEESN